MASLRALMAFCAPAALVAFVVRPGPGHSLFRAPSSPTDSTSAIQQQQQQQGQQWGSLTSAVGALFAKPMAYDVTHKPAANSSVILNLDIPGETTKLCYDKAIRALSKEAGNSIPGFASKGNNKHPPQVIERHFGIEEVKGQSLKIISELVIQEAINSLDLKAIGSAELVQDIEVVTQLFNPGSPIMLEVKMDVWPEVKIEKEYTGFDLEVEEPPLDESR